MTREPGPERGRAPFVEPPWDAALDAQLALAAIPQDAQISGMFTLPLLAEAKRLGVTRLPARERYVAFQFYPLREHVQLLLELCQVAFPDQTLRAALRKLGRGARLAFIASTLGRVVFGSAAGVTQCVAAFAKGYELNLRPGRASVLESDEHHVIVHLDEIHYFLDCHHVGAFEGVLKHAGAQGHVTLDQHSPSCADLLLEW